MFYLFLIVAVVVVGYCTWLILTRPDKRWMWPGLLLVYPGVVFCALFAGRVQRDADANEATREAIRLALAKGTIDRAIFLHTQHWLEGLTIRSQGDPEFFLTSARFDSIGDTVIRRAPSAKAAVIQRVSAHESVIVPPGPTARNGWIQTRKPSVGWIETRFLVAVDLPNYLIVFSDFDSPLYTSEKASLRSQPDRRSSLLESLPVGTKVLYKGRQGYWFRVLAGQKLGWTHTSVLRTARDPELNAERTRALSFSVRFIFPERTLAGKALGVAGGLAMGLLMAIFLPFVSLSENASIGKLLASLFYYIFKNLAVVQTLSFNALLLATFVGFFLAASTEATTESLVIFLRKRILRE